MMSPGFLGRICRAEYQRPLRYGTEIHARSEVPQRRGRAGLARPASPPRPRPGRGRTLGAARGAVLPARGAAECAPMANPNEIESKQPGLPAIDTNEYGGKRDGERQAMNRRLFM